MPLTVRVDPELRVIFVVGHGVILDDDLLGYVAEYLGGGELHGYDELFDLTDADLLDLTYTGLANTAAAAAATDPEGVSVKVALLVSEVRGMGITRLYQSLRESKGGRRQTRVFTDNIECRDWLGIPV